MTQLLTLIFEAHGTTFDNEAHLSSGWNDVDLSPLGEQQSVEMGMRYKDDHFDAVFTSDMARAYRSAEIGFGDRWPIIQDKRLRECDYGDLTQKPSDVVDREKPGRLHVPFPNGESYDQTLARMKFFWTSLKRDYADKRVMVIGHRATQYAIQHIVEGAPYEKLVTTHFKWQPGWVYEVNDTKALKIIHKTPTPTPEAKALKEALEKLGVKVYEEVDTGYMHIDLAIPKAKINIEVDGIHHLTDPKQIVADLNRGYYSNMEGYNTMHIPNEMIRKHLEEISNALAEASKIREKQIHVHLD